MNCAPKGRRGRRGRRGRKGRRGASGRVGAVQGPRGILLFGVTAGPHPPRRVLRLSLRLRLGRRVLRLRLRLRLRGRRRVLLEPRKARKRARVLASCAALARALALAIRARGDNADAGGMHLSSLHVLLGGQHFSIFLSPSHTAGLQCAILGTPGGGHVVPPRFLRVRLRPPRSPFKLSSRWSAAALNIACCHLSRARRFSASRSFLVPTGALFARRIFGFLGLVGDLGAVFCLWKAIGGGIYVVAIYNIYRKFYLMALAAATAATGFASATPCFAFSIIYSIFSFCFVWARPFNQPPCRLESFITPRDLIPSMLCNDSF